MADEDDKLFAFARQGILFILSAPSGAGKTTLSRQLLNVVPNLHSSVSYTTRTPREGEVAGRDYHFIGEEQFTRLRLGNAFAEWAQVHEASYGTARAPLDEALARGQDLLLDIDVQGARQIKACYAEAVSIFILPPAWQILESRLRKRGTDREEVIARRLRRARDEANELFTYDYYVVNDQVERAATILLAIIEAERARVSRLRRTHNESQLQEVLITWATHEGPFPPKGGRTG
ncbi:MAG: guanylate kinase [Candidatus Binatia bacterium]